MKLPIAVLLATMGVLGANAYAASPNIEPNNIPYQGVYGHVDAQAPSHAQVQAELAQARAAGLVTSGEEDYPPAQLSTRSGKTRMEVRAELADAKARGDYSFGELDYPPGAN